MAGSFFRPRRLAHVNLWVDDIARSEAFYRDTCGLMIEFTEPDLEATFMGVGHTQHDLGMMKTTHGQDRYGRDGILQIPGHIGQVPGLNHIAWEVHNEAELLKAHRAARQAGVRLDTAMDHQIAHSIYLFDPDGNYNEFYSDTIADWRSVLAGEMGLITGRWDPETAVGSEDGKFPVGTVARTFPAAPIQPRRVTHLVLQTTNMEEMLNFYTVVAGMQVVRRLPGAVYLRASLPDYDCSLVLVQGAGHGYHHVSFELDNEKRFEAGLAGLAARGVQPECVMALPWKRSVFLRDPDGLLSEWYVTLPGERNLDAHDSDLLPFAV
jgi:catechol 2,3-dioxygenase